MKTLDGHVGGKNQLKFRAFLAAVGVFCFTISGHSLGAVADDYYRLDFSKEAIAARKAKAVALVNSIHEKIAATSKESSEGEMSLYTNRIPGVNVAYVMVPIKGGEFLMGSPETEPGRQKDEGPLHKVRLSPFWMEQCEVTWDEYEPFMLDVEAKKPADVPDQSEAADAVAKPSKPYLDMSFGMGKEKCPAVGMTQHAANKFCEWLSAKTGHFHRLPTEAEWECACRAGTSTAYSFGDEPSKLPAFAWYEDNCCGRYARVGRKKPNPWGLYDMHGNVAEWCLDQYDANFYAQGKDKISEDPWNVATKRFPHVIRGGAWDSSGGVLPLDSQLGQAPQLRSAARFGSRPEWNTDTSLPQTIWYLDQAKFVGFRVVRPLRIPSAEEMYHYWNSGLEHGYGRDL